MKKNTVPSLLSINKITRHTKKLFSYLGFTAGIFFATPLLDATTYTVSNTNDTGTGSFRSALTSAQAGDTINFDLSGTQTITMGSNYPRININPLNINPSNPLTINGQSTVTISGNSLYQPFFLQSGSLVLQELNIENCTAQGGNGGVAYGPDNTNQLPGGGCGGGGLGAGGALFINENAQATLTSVTINNCVAAGGFGGAYQLYGTAAITPASGSGGGGMFFEGGNGGYKTTGSTTQGVGGGGGGGLATAGLSPTGAEGGAGGVGGGGAGGNGTGSSVAPTPGEPGFPEFGGGGGGGGEAYAASEYFGSYGGSGSFGGGGGGGAGTALGGFLNHGGQGSYGGGGGGQGQSLEESSPALSIFGGGNGGVAFGGAGGGGGGGAGLGGAIFVGPNATLTFTGGNFGNTSQNVVIGGLPTGGTPGGTSGIGSGQDLFIAGGSTVTINSALNATTVVEQITSDNFNPCILNIGGNGTVDLEGGGTFIGTVSVAHGSTLELDDSLTATPITVDGTLYQTHGNVNEVIVNADGVFNNGQSSATVNTAQVSGSMEISGAITTLNLFSGGTASTQGGFILTATVSGQLSIDPNGYVNTLVLNSGGTASNNGVIEIAEVSGNLTIESGAGVDILTVNSAGTATSSGQVTTADVFGNLTINSTGQVQTLTVESGGMTTDSGAITTATVSGNLAVNTGGTVNTLTINSGGTTTDSGAITTATVSGNLAVNTGGTVNTLTVESGGTTTDSGAITAATVSGNLAVNSTGQVQTLTVNSGATTTDSGAITTATVSGNLAVNTGGTVNTLTINPTGITTNSGNIVNATDNGSLSVNNGGTVSSVIVGSGASLTNSGTITSATSTGTVSNETGGTVGTLTLNAGNATNAGAITLANINSGSVLSDTGSIGTAYVGGTLNISGTASNVTVSSGGIVSTSGMLGTVDIMNGGLLEGTGSITALTNGGALILGTNGSGTINAGSYKQTQSGTLYDLIAPAGAIGMLKVSGNANLGGTLAVTPLPGLYLKGVTYPVITTGGTVTGTFSTFTSNSLPLSIIYQTNAVLLTATKTQFYGMPNPSVKGNASRVLNNLLGLNYANDPCLAQAVMALPLGSNSELSKVLNQMQPVIYQGLSLTTFENLITYQQVLSGRSELFNQFPYGIPESDCCEEVYQDTVTAGFWVAPFGLFIDQNKLGSLRRYHANTYGAAIGLDSQLLPNILGGVSLGYSQSTIDWSANSGNSNFHSGYFGIYSGGFLDLIDDFYFDVSTVVSFERYHGHRNINFFHKKANNKHSGFAFDGHLGIGYRYEQCALRLEPYASFDYSYVQQNRFKEKGAACLDLHVRNNHSNLLRYELGVQFSTPVEYCSVTVLPGAYLSYVRRQIIDGDKFTANFTHQKNTFNVYGKHGSLNKVAGGVSVNFLINDGNMMSMAYDAEYSPNRENSQSFIFTLEHMY